MNFSGFQWDDGNWLKCGSHGLTKPETEAVFQGDVRIAPDFKHSAGERRYIAVARNANGRPLFVGFTLREVDDQLLVRPVIAATCIRRRHDAMKRKVPIMTTDEEAEAFLEQDLSDLDFSQFKPYRFEFENKTARVNMRLPEGQLAVLKEEARKRGIPYQRFMRELLERGLQNLKAS